MKDVAFVIEQRVGSWGGVAIAVLSDEAEANRVAALWNKNARGEFWVAKYRHAKDESDIGARRTVVPSLADGQWAVKRSGVMIWCSGAEDARSIGGEPVRLVPCEP
jgi:hypothetical protein